MQGLRQRRAPGVRRQQWHCGRGRPHANRRRVGPHQQASRYRLRQSPLGRGPRRLQQLGYVRGVADRRHGVGAQDGRLHDASPRQPETNQTLRCDPDVSQGPGVRVLQRRLQAVVRGEQLGGPPWWIGPTGARHCPLPVTGSRAPTSEPASDSLRHQRLAMCAHRSRYDDGSGRRLHGRRDGQLRHRPDQLPCQVNSFDCNYDRNYDGKPGSTDPGWRGERRRVRRDVAEPGEVGSASRA